MLFTRTFAMVPTVLVAAFAQPDILGDLDEWMNVLQSIQLPFAMIPVLHFTSMPNVMGTRFCNGTKVKALGWVLSIVIIALGLFTAFQPVFQSDIPW